MINPTLTLLCVDDEAVVLDAVVRDLAPFEDAFRIETALSAAEAGEIVDGLAKRGNTLALVLCDHLMPGLSGTDFLIALDADPATRPARKILLTAQAGQDDTIRAVNQGGLDYFIAKPWQPDALCKIIRDQLTTFVIDRELNPLPYLAILDTARLAEYLQRRNPGDG